MYPLAVVLLLGFLIPSNLVAQSIYSEVDSVSYAQFDTEISEFLKRAKSLSVKSALHLSLQKLAYDDFLEGKRDSLPDIYEGGGKKVLLNSYLEIGRVAALLYTLEHLEEGEVKARYRTLLLNYIKITSKSLSSLANIGEKDSKGKGRP